MKKFIVFVLIAAAGYFAWDKLLKEQPALEVNDERVVSVNNGMNMDIEAPVLFPVKHGMIRGTVKNVSSKPVKNIILKYRMGRGRVEARIDYLEPGGERSFATPHIQVKSSTPQYVLEELSYE